MKKALKKSVAFLTSIAAASSMLINFDVTPKKTVVEAATQLVAFPGAVGGGKYATGGRGGEVYHVTNLNDSGEGSLRDAVSQSNRIVVFDVSGTIELKSNIVCQSNITIAGQTAPGGSGITLKNYKFGMGGDNIICRYISSRPGPYASTTSGNDAWGGAKGSNSIIDHCSMGWTTDEQWALYSNNEYYTVQYSVIGPADSWGGHSKGIHGFGIMLGKGYCTFDHNLIVHNVSRNFRGKVVGQETADFTNNVIYNWAYQTAYGTIGHLNYVNNTLKMGNGTVSGKHYVYVDSSTSPENFSIYCTGNRMLNKDNTIYDTVTSDNWNGISVKDGLGITKDSVKSTSAFQTVVNGENVSTATTCESAEASYENVLNFAGNGISPLLRTAIDIQSAEECRTGTGYHSGSASYEAATDDEKSKIDGYQIQCGVTYTYPDAVLTKTITDADNDGMADDWELARGLNPNDASDTNGDYCGLGYTNIEYYINDLTVDSFPEGVVTPSPESTVDPISAFETIEAENFSTQSGIVAEDSGNGGQNVGYIENGDYIMFRAVDFEDGARSFTAKVASSLEGGNIELYLDSISGTPIATCPITGTGGWQDYVEASFNIPVVTGRHNLYLKFTGGESYLMNIDSFIFGREALPMNGNLIKNLYILDDSTMASWSIDKSFVNGDLLYGDRPVTVVQLPGETENSEALITACDAKNSTSDLAKFVAGADIKVYAAFDSRVTTLPSWVGDWAATGLSFQNSNSVTYNLYVKEYAEGAEIILGQNGQSSGCVNYMVMVTENKTTDIEPTTEPPTSEPTKPPTPEPTAADTTVHETSNYGDSDEDNDITIADAIRIMSYVTNSEANPLTESGLDNADVYQRGDGVGINDAVSIQKYLTKIISELPESWM